MKSILKKLLFNMPVLGRAIFQSTVRAHIKNAMEYDVERNIQYAGYINSHGEAYMQFMLLFTAHGIEKGLTMPDFRYGFGKNAICNVAKLLREYRQANYDCTAMAYIEALRVLKEYRTLHAEAQHPLCEQVVAALSVLDDAPEVEPSSQLEMSQDEYWSACQADFATFAQSRHSARNLHGKVSHEQIIQAVKLANCAPSACNRQFSRVHLYEGKELVQKMLALQNGNRGFGHTVEQLILVTSDMAGIVTNTERNDLYTNAGIYIMNLSYALHYYKVPHCMLNWMVTKETDLEMRKLAGIPGRETINIVIVCGQLPDKFKLTASPRLSWDKVLTIHGEA